MNTAVGTGTRSLALLAPQIVLGAMLAVCPDTRVPLVAQLLTLLHVSSAIASLLAFALWATLHTRNGFATRTAVRGWRNSGAGLTRSALAASAFGAYATGGLVLWYGQGTRVGEWHAAMGLALAWPLALHLLLDGRTAARRVACLYLLIGPLALPSLRATVRPKATPIPEVAFTRQTRDVSLYDSPEWCGGCHVSNYEEWAHSTHARALALPTVRRNLEKELNANPALLSAELDPSAESGKNCVQCHAPVTFFGTSPTPVLADTVLEGQGISCGFCHTLRGLDESGFYVSAPETVQRYLGQNSATGLVRRIGDLLIRWRPEVHRRDYRAPFLHQVAACVGCHGESYESWRASPYAGQATVGDHEGYRSSEGEGVSCQDCHMAREPKALPVREPDRLVPWGDIRPQRRQHVWRGGNARAAILFGDEEGAKLDRGLRDGMLTLRILEVRREAFYVKVTVALSNDKVGHHFPSGEGGDARNQWLQLETLDRDGRPVAVTLAPDTRAPDFDQREAPGRGIALIHQRGMTGQAAEQDTRVPPKQERTYHLSVPDGAGLARVRVSVRSTFDPAFIASAEATLEPTDSPAGAQGSWRSLAMAKPLPDDPTGSVSDQ